MTGKTGESSQWKSVPRFVRNKKYTTRSTDSVVPLCKQNTRESMDNFDPLKAGWARRSAKAGPKVDIQPRTQYRSRMTCLRVGQLRWPPLPPANPALFTAAFTHECQYKSKSTSSRSEWLLLDTLQKKWCGAQHRHCSTTSVTSCLGAPCCLTLDISTLPSPG